MCDKSDAAAGASLSGPESSMVDTKSREQSSEQHENPVPKCYPKWRGKPVFDGNKDALGWTLISIAMMLNYVGVGAFLATTVLKIAENVSLCHSLRAGTTTLDLDTVCGPAITAFKPSSLLTLYTMIISFVAAWILPFTGAVIDYTRHRLLIGRITAGLFSILLFPLMFLSVDNYILILICHGCSVFVGWFVNTLHFAYLPELTPDEIKLTNWTKYFTIWSYGAMALYLGVIMGGVIVLKRTSDGIFISHFGMGVLFGVNFIFQNFAWWFLFGKRESFHKLPEGSNLFTVGFKQLFKTGSLIVKNYRSLKFFYLYISLSNSGWQAFGIFLSKSID